MTPNSYIKKRRWNKNGTTEPKGELSKVKDTKTGRPIYLIHLHDSSHLHRDLRLEMDGVLKSWAIPKDPLLTLEGKKILAVSVEDHPLSYSTFEGLIPEGQYGAGTVKIWDNGTYELIEKTDKGFVIKINGNKLKGTFVLFKFKPPNNWLFFKKKE
jgi:DNA ligase D-like protein (predicted 3'-phosphoesterase)